MDRYEEEKQLAASAAVGYVKNNMILGVGSGSTVQYFIEALGERVQAGLHVLAVPTSVKSEQLCELHGIPVCKNNTAEPVIDLTVDGADEFDPQLNLIKGGGGALLREKIVASASIREIIIADSRKKVETLGQTFPLPIEVLPYAISSVLHKIKAHNMTACLRLLETGDPCLTDQGNYILDCKTGPIRDLHYLSDLFNQMAGVVEHGIFMDMADMVIMGNQGAIETYEAHNPVIPKEVQRKTLRKIEEKIQICRSKGEVPVIELDLDLTTFVTRERTLEGLHYAGKKYGIEEFVTPSFGLLPGYTREAWIHFISHYHLTQRYPKLRWMGEKDGKDGDSVYPAFHTQFWKTEFLHLDTLTPGLSEFITRMQKSEAVVVFVSGRWKEEQILPTLEVLKKGGLETIPLLIGNPMHDGANPISDSEIKAIHQTEICRKYGVPAVIIDDRQSNRNAVIQTNPDSEILGIGCAIPGFTYDQETTGIEWKISTFFEV